MEAFFRYERIPRFTADFPFAVTQTHHRIYEFAVDHGDAAHRLALHHVWRMLLAQDRRLQLYTCGELDKEKGIWAIHRFTKLRSFTAFQPDLVDLYYLHAHIRAHRPRVVLEYGSGISTAVMANALALNGEGVLYSLEPSEEWAQSTAGCVPPELRNRVKVIYSPATETTVFGQRTFCFADQPVDSPDMVYIDGAPAGAVFQGAENLEALGTLKSGTAIYIDARRRAVDYFVRKNAETDRFEISGYMVLVSGYGEVPTLSLGADLFANGLVRVR